MDLEPSDMTDPDQKREDDVLRRMLATKPKPHKSNRDKEPETAAERRRRLERPDFQNLELDVGRTPFVGEAKAEIRKLDRPTSEADFSEPAPKHTTKRPDVKDAHDRHANTKIFVEAPKPKK
jgi:hypothetical protein